MSAEKNISQFIQNQFPAIYREEGEMFVEFVKQYYEWMEDTNNTLYHSRRQTEYKDIDETVDDFVVRFKEKYLADIQLDTVAQTRKLVKSSLDLYRAKGTERAVDLFFRAIFGKSAEVYYPGDDVFRLSDGKWVKPKYLEVTASDHNVTFVGKQIVGVSSGATAFVERYIRRKIKSKYVNVFYISAISGEFQTDELISLPGEYLKNLPKMVGSLTTLQVIVGGADFTVGDIVTLESDNGVQGKARVAKISDITGIVEFEIVDYGWGYSSNAQVLVSEKVLNLSNVTTNTASLRDMQFDIFETLKQPMANVVIINANTDISNTVIGSNLYTYYSNNAVAGIGRIMAFTASGTTNGEVYVAELKNTIGPVIEPAANSTGTVSVTNITTPLSGVTTTTANSANLTGIGTLYSTELKAGAIVTLYEYNSNNELLATETKKITSVANNTSAVLDSVAATTSSNVAVILQGGKIVVGTSTAFNTDFVYGDTIAIYSNSTNYILRTVNAVTNSTYLTLQENVNFANTAANYAEVIANNKIYTEGNVASANISTRSDKSATANVIGVSSNLTIYTANQINGTFSNNEQIYQLDSFGTEIANALVVSLQTSVGANAAYTVRESNGVFIPNGTLPILSRYTNGTITAKSANLISLDLSVGVVSISNTFNNTAFNYITGIDSYSNATVSRVSSGVLADFNLSTSRQYPEEITISNDLVEPYLFTNINAAQYGFVANAVANGQTIIQNMFDAQTYTIGGISILTNVNPGKNYDTAPFVTIYDPVISKYDLHDYVIEILNPTLSFLPGEVVYQDVTGANGVVKSANLTHINVRRIQFENQFDTVNKLNGSYTKATADVLTISPDYSSLPIGLDAVISANVQSSAGAVSTLEVFDSGFGYINGEDATFTSADGLKSGLVRLGLGKHGQSEGFYANKKGQISADKYVFDGEYYQDYSYEIRSAISPDKYKEMLKKVLHVAGTKSFSATVISQTANTSSNVISEITEE